GGGVGGGGRGRRGRGAGRWGWFGGSRDSAGGGGVGRFIDHVHGEERLLAQNFLHHIRVDHLRCFQQAGQGADRAGITGWHHRDLHRLQIGRASCRERV